MSNVLEERGSVKRCFLLVDDLGGFRDVRFEGLAREDDEVAAADRMKRNADSKCRRRRLLGIWVANNEVSRAGVVRE